MTDQNDAVLYSLKELKDMPKGEVAQVAAQSGANIKRKKSGNSGWASDDDAGDLLAGILDETSRSAEQEGLKRSRELMSLKKAEQTAKEEEAARRREEGERRLAEEQARREDADRRRRALVREIEGPSPEEIEEERRAAEAEAERIALEKQLREAERARLEAERRAAQAAREAKVQEDERLRALAEGPAPVANKGAKAAGIGLAAVALLFVLFLVVVGGGVGAYFAFSPKEIPTQTYAKALLKPTVVTATSVEQGFVATAKPEPVPTDADSGAVASAGAKNNTKSRRGAGRASKSSGGSKKADSKSSSGSKFNFGVKKKGGIVF